MKMPIHMQGDSVDPDQRAKEHPLLEDVYKVIKEANLSAQVRENLKLELTVFF